MIKLCFVKFALITVFLLKVHAAEDDQINMKNMSISPAGVKLIERFEGFRGEIYKCPGGSLTVGYGHAVKKGEEGKFAKGISQNKAH